jgi:hypothetical protein
VRFLVFYVSGEGSGHIQSLLLGTMLMGTGFLLIVVGLLADLTAVNRKLLEGVDARLHRVEDGLVEKRGVDRRAHLPDDGRLEDRLVVED